MVPTAAELLGVDVALFLLVGLLGGAHCIGMCGPLVTVYADRMGPESDPAGDGAVGGSRDSHLTTYEVRQHALFNVGRATSYTLIGALLGAIGGAVFLTAETLTSTAGVVRGTVGVLVGLFVVVIGARYLLGGAAAGIHLPGLERVTGRLMTHVDRLANGPGIVLLGGLHGLLPCPILYPAYLYAFASGSAASGALALAALGIGTIPAVFAYGTVIEAVDAVHRKRLHRLLGVVFLALGYVLFAHGLMSLGIHVPHPMFPFYDPLSGAGSG
ncbi:sulfite exporter TauE/SafE family protein [Halopenitus persicus]|uniref:sulfite exporter TauE/SafE family protein n=1 Tax=Halopenitus persicus TaxID=1048396 RepID=UPI000BBAE6DE|nr:sulfite exporter TauE/SafE family protein [Halopenitus persicus]